MMFASPRLRVFIPVAILAGAVGIALMVLQRGMYEVHTFTEPIDAISIGVPGDTIDLEVSALIRGTWTPWERLEIEKEFDPTLRESNLVTFPEEVTKIRVRGRTAGY